jgi:hypothetical protein
LGWHLRRWSLHKRVPQACESAGPSHLPDDDWQKRNTRRTTENVLYQKLYSLLIASNYT